MKAHSSHQIVVINIRLHRVKDLQPTLQKSKTYKSRIGLHSASEHFKSFINELAN